jgi:hypothetical protein
METADRTGRARIGLELILTSAILAGVAYAAWFLHARGYLPQPFHHDPADSLMDLYNTAYWANRPGAYTIWGSIYPPLSFVFLKIVTIHRCYLASPLDARDCDWRSWSALLAAYLAAWIPLAIYYFRLQRSTAAMRTIATALGLPMLYALERGNLIVVAFALSMLSCAEVLSSPRVRELAYTLAFNLKPYLIVLIAPQVIKRRWWAVAATIAACLVVYLITYAVEGAGSPLTLIANVRLLMRHTGTHAWNNLYYATTYWQLLGALGGGFAGQLGLSAAAATVIRVGLIGLIVLGQAGAVACYALAWRRPAEAPVARLTALTMALMLTSFGSSGYATIFLLPLAFRETGKTPLTALVVGCAYLLCIPIDWVVRPLFHIPVHSFLGGRDVVADYGLSIGQLVRPGLLLLIQYALALLILGDLGVRWAGRPGRPRDDAIAPAR